MIVKTSMHTPDIIITNGTDMKVNFRFYDEVMKENFVYFHGFSIKQSKHHHYKRHHTMERVIKPSHGIGINGFWGDTGRRNPSLGFYYPSLSLFQVESANIKLHLKKYVLMFNYIWGDPYTFWYSTIYEEIQMNTFLDTWKTTQKLKLEMIFKYKL